DTREIWPHPFNLSIEITVGDSLRVALITRNTGDAAITLSQALHTYFNVGDISKVQVLGLDGIGYLDKLDHFAKKTQSGPVVIDAEVDRIYTDVSGDLVIDDGSLARRIRISASGCSTAVVWNPWIDIARSMGDLGDDDYQHLLCVETANAGPETIEIAAGDEYRLQAEYTIES
ncbi:MAG: D-hexose-6-phosphate mutarotase, partial [Gammaproteobacteria bacterium]|nr:D-hexose-6-phosphate mutarotase [Gammaproteobacteria bacterium]